MLKTLSLQEYAAVFDVAGSPVPEGFFIEGIVAILETVVNLSRQEFWKLSHNY